MTGTVAVPDALRRSVIGFGGERGAQWADAVPELVAGYVERWDLSLDLPPSGTPWHGAVGIVVPVRTHDGASAVLKISPPDPENEHEHTALAAWNGDGAVRLLAADGPRRALLLDRLAAGRDLTTVPVDDALPVLADLLNRLAVPAPEQVGTVAAEAERWADELPRRWRDAGVHEPRRLLERALAATRELGASAGCRLIHTDLHYENVLAAPRDAVTGRDVWLAIDPKPLAGAPEFAVVPMLWNRLDELDTAADRSAALRERMRRIVEAAGLDLDATREWSIVREVVNLVSYAENGMADDQRRSAWVAHSLAG